MRTARLGQREYASDVRRIALHAGAPFQETGLLSATLLPNRCGGGRLRWAWLAQGPQNWGAASLAEWTETHIADADYATTPNGAPYVTLDGANDYLSFTDPYSWVALGSEEFLVWAWIYLSTVGADRYAVSRWDVGGNQRSYRLVYNHASTAFMFSTSSDGMAGTVVNATSAYAEAVDTWYFLAGYFQPSTIQRIYVGAVTDDALTATDTAGAPPASIFDGTAITAIGAGFNSAAAAYFWPGRISIAAQRANVPAADITNLVTRIWQITKRYYA